MLKRRRGREKKQSACGLIVVLSNFVRENVHLFSLVNKHSEVSDPFHFIKQHSEACRPHEILSLCYLVVGRGGGVGQQIL